MRPRRLGLHGLLFIAAGLVLLDLFAAPRAGETLGAFLTDPAHRLRDTHVALRTGAVVAGLAWAYGRFGVWALLATPAAIGPLFVAALPPVTGDEPHYLMITVSLERDHDFAVADNYARGDGGRLGYPTLGPSPGHPRLSPQSLHYPGGPVLALPGWILGGRRWALLGVTVLATLLVYEMLALNRTFGIPAGPGGLAVAMVMFTPPVLLLMRQFYPDILGAFCLMHLARRLAETVRGLSGASGRRAALAPWTCAAAAAGAPWLHARFIPGVVLLVAMLAVRDRRMRKIPPVAMAASVGLMAVVFQHWYGSPFPTAPYADFPVRSPSPFRGLVGMFADTHAGLVLTAPLLVAALVAVPALWRASRLWAVSIGAVVGLAVIQNSAFRFWHAGYSTPARPWAALLPLGAPLVGLAIERIPRAMAVAGAATALLAVTLLAFPPLSYPNPNRLTSLWGVHGFTFLPVIDSPDQIQHGLSTPLPNCAIAIGALAVLIGLTAWALERRPDRASAAG